MNRINSLLIAAIVVGFLPSPIRAQAPKKPNVILIVADDLNTNLGCYGHPIVKTPNLDKLAKRGVRFERAYTQCPICNPSRTSFLSGYRPGQGPNMLRDATWLPMHFLKNGYIVASIGKVAHTPAMAKLCGFPDKTKSNKNVVAGVREFLAENRTKPFFLGIGLAQTHPGYQSLPQFRKLYPPDKVAWEKEPPDIRARVPPVAFAGFLTQKLDDAQRRKHIASYWAAVSTLDSYIGGIIEALEKEGLLDNTIILFTSDHGRHLGEHGGIYDKRSLFEESVRVPLIVSSPGKKGNAVSLRLVEMVDFYPTLVQLAGLAPPKHLEGTSFAPLLDDPLRDWKKAAYSESAVSGRLGRSVRTERYRYTQWSEKEAQLYDHQRDPREQVNLFGDPKHAPIVTQMRDLLRAR